MEKHTTMEAYTLSLLTELSTPAKHKILTNKELPELLKVHSRTIQKWRDEGLLAYSKIGREIFYTLEDVLEMLRNNRFRNSVVDPKEQRVLTCGKNRNFFSLLVSKCVGRWKKEDHDYDISVEFLQNLYLSQEGLCAISKKKLTFCKNKSLSRLSVDRIDSSKGYVKGNIQLVCYGYNMLKNNFLQKEVLDFLK